MDEELPETLQQAEDALQAGRIETARMILIEYLQRAPRSERAWWLLSFAAPETWQKTDCLAHLLRLNPANGEARARLVLLQAPKVELPSSAVNPFTFDPEEDLGVENPLTLPNPKPGIPDDAPPPSVALPAVPLSPGPPAQGARKKSWVVEAVVASSVICVILGAAGVIGIGRTLQNQATQQTQVAAQELADLGAANLAPDQTSTPTVSPSSTNTSTPTFTRTASFTPTDTTTPRPSLTRIMTATPRSSGSTGPNVGQYAPDFSLVQVGSGEKLSLGQFNGQPVLLFFWATWCPICRQELPALEQIHQQYKDSGLVVIAIDGGEAYYIVNTFLESHTMSFHVLVDPQYEAMSSYRVDAVPRHYFISASGQIDFVGPGSMDFTALQAQAQALLVGFVPPTPTP